VLARHGRAAAVAAPDFEHRAVVAPVLVERPLSDAAVAALGARDVAAVALVLQKRQTIAIVNRERKGKRKGDRGKKRERERERERG
jgi:hypothetical protein